MAENEKKVAETKEVKAPAKKAAPKKEAKPVEEKKVEEKKAEEVKPLATEASAKLLNYGATPRKVRLVADLVRGKDLDEAYAILDNCEKLCARDVKKVIQSAAANAVNNFHMNGEDLYVASIQVGDALKLKRILPRARGSASGLVKRWSNIYVTVKNREAK
jgi:large subunit ribosomal protein L22